MLQLFFSLYFGLLHSWCLKGIQRGVKCDKYTANAHITQYLITLEGIKSLSHVLCTCSCTKHCDIHVQDLAYVKNSMTMCF